MRNIPDKICREKTQILCSVIFLENHAVYEIMWKSMVQPERQDNMAHAYFMLVN